MGLVLFLIGFMQWLFYYRNLFEQQCFDFVLTNCFRYSGVGCCYFPVLFLVNALGCKQLSVRALSASEQRI